ncbi:hypothetical protein OH492_29145 [Vibrio chagasii]|nr:hypothetical protein [Vibrio chagasii]
MLKQQVELSLLSPRIETVGYVAFDESALWQTNVRAVRVESCTSSWLVEGKTLSDVLFTPALNLLRLQQKSQLSAYNQVAQVLIKDLD